MPIKENAIRFTVPLVPPSVNHYKMRTNKGVTFVSGDAKAYKQALAIFARGLSVMSAEYEVGISVYLGKKGKGDVDNFAKCVLDGMVEAGVIHSDAAITKLTIRKGRDWDNPRTEVYVEAL